MRPAMAILLVALASVPGAFAASGSSLWDWFVIPAAAHVEGAQGTFWRTDVTIVNPYGWRSITVEIRLLVTGQNNTSGPEHSFNIGANEQLVLEDVVLSTFGVTGTGALVLQSPDGAYFTVSARTYTGDSATFGQTENGQKNVCHADDNALIAGIRDDARYRTNIGVVNAASRPAEIRARVFSDGGSLVATKVFELEPWSHQQVSLRSFGGAVSSGYLRWDSLSTDYTQWVAYASVVDESSGDAVFLEEREDAQLTQYRPTYDLDGWWFGSFSGPAGSGSLYVLVSQDGPSLDAYTFTLDGYMEVYVGGYVDGTAITIEGGYGNTIPCWNDYITGGQATATSSSISGSYQAIGDCYEGTTTFYLTPTSPPKFAAAATACTQQHRGPREHHAAGR